MGTTNLIDPWLQINLKKMSRVCVVVLDEDNPEISRSSEVFTEVVLLIYLLWHFV